MRRVALAALLALGVLFLFSKSVGADHAGDFLPALPTEAMKQVRERGYGLYRLDARASSWPGFRITLRQFYTQECEKTRICWVEQEDPYGEYDLLHSMPDSWSYGDGIVGVAWYFLYPARIDYNWRVPYSSFLSTQGHEHGHVDGQEDLYRHLSNGGLQCDVTVWWSRMSCGTAIWWVTDYDRDIVWNVYIGDLPSASFFLTDGTWVWIGYNSIRQSSVGCSPFSGQSFFSGRASEADNYCGHFSRYLDNVSRVAIFYRDQGFDWAWTGYYGPPAPTGGWGSRGFAVVDWCRPGRSWAVHPESALGLTFPTFAGGVGFLSGDLLEVGMCP